MSAATLAENAPRLDRSHLVTQLSRDHPSAVFEKDSAALAKVTALLAKGELTSSTGFQPWLLRDKNASKVGLAVANTPYELFMPLLLYLLLIARHASQTSLLF